METISFFERKLPITPTDFNKLKKLSIDDILIEKAREKLENKCSEHGFVLPGSIKLISRSIPRFEDGNKTGDSITYVKLEGRVVYPADGIRVIGEVIRKNKMGLYIEYKNAIRIQVPRDLHIGSEEYESVEIGDLVEVELKRSKFQINDPYILASGIFISKKSETNTNTNTVYQPIQETEQTEQTDEQDNEQEEEEEEEQDNEQDNEQEEEKEEEEEQDNEQDNKQDEEEEEEEEQDERAE
jgi:hypothetical protein